MNENFATSSAPRSRGRLLQVLGAGFGLAVIIGNTIGAGIARTPGEIAAALPSAWMFVAVWVAGGLYALLGVNALAELGTLIPRSGGQFVFSLRALGPYPAFIVGWSDWMSNCGVTALVSLVIAEYAGALAPQLAQHQTAVASAVALLFALLQWRGISWGKLAQDLTSSAKTLGFLLLAGACFLLGGKQASLPAAGPAVVPSGLALAGAVLMALQSVIYSYDGWNGVLYFSEEVREPGRNIPRAMFGGVLAVMGIYVLLSLALVYVVPVREFAGSVFALGLAAERIFGAHAEAILMTIMIVSLVSGLNAYHLMASRVLFGMCRDGLFSRRLAVVNAGGTPTAALALSAAVALGFILTGTFEKVLAVNAFFFVANYTLSFISLFVLRRREPAAPRPWAAWGHPWTTGLALAGAIAFLSGMVAADTRNSVRSLVLLAASYPAYRFLGWLDRRVSS